ncbi:hypothetical protein AWC17_21695 [Mycobacterium nebraskense]|uniref:Uncharacterized protein n=2 Tax=Mycobacterium nebraskense TaxID=244292 RepID=A0A1X2A379_9MYCO|nr:hypothetical protein AWC17_21695 [Mycobacterium nebraskense]
MARGRVAMGVGALLASLGCRRAHVLLAEVPGHFELRASVERSLFRRGWCPALSPADADILAVCGVPGPELAKIIDLIWDQMPGPRVRIEIQDFHSVDSALTRGGSGLLDTNRHRRDAAQRGQVVDPGSVDGLASSEGCEAQGDSNPDMDNVDMDHGGHDDMGHGGHDDMGHGGHQHMGHGGMEMAPAGIPLAEGAEDRDGLEMDVLHVRLGPVLAYWPSGLVLKCSLQGDVVVDADAWVVDADRDGGTSVAPGKRAASLEAATECDHLRSLLALAGWSSAADHARQIRDLLLDEPAAVDRAQLLLEKLLRKLRRSWLLRWSLQDLGHFSVADAERYRLPAALGGDTYDRLLAHVDNALACLSLSHKAFRADPANVIGALPELVRGLEVATARLVVASLGVDVTPVGRASHV